MAADAYPDPAPVPFTVAVTVAVFRPGADAIYRSCHAELAGIESRAVADTVAFAVDAALDKLQS